MDPVTTIASTLTRLRTTFNDSEQTLDERTWATLSDFRRALNDGIIEIQNAALHLAARQMSATDEIQRLRGEARLLRRQIIDLEQSRIERGQYRLNEIASGVFVLAHEQQQSGDDLRHYFCQPCMDNASKKVVLQRTYYAHKRALWCPVCRHEYTLGKQAWN